MFENTSAQRQGQGPEVSSAENSAPGSQRGGAISAERLEKSGVAESKGPSENKLPTLNGQTYINHLTWREAGTTPVLGGKMPYLY